MAKAKKRKNEISVKTQLAVVTGAVCLLAVFGLFVAWLDNSTTKTITPRTYADITIKGTSVCLPTIENKSVRSDDEKCVQGIKTASGIYYQLEGTANRRDDNTIEVTGTLASPKNKDTVISNGVLTLR